jgi:hypothetical protein
VCAAIFVQKGTVSLAAFAETPILSDTDSGKFATVEVQQIRKKLLGRLRGEFPRKVDDPAQKARVTEYFKAFPLRHEQQRRLFRTENCTRMRSKGDHRGGSSGGGGHFPDGTQNRLMSQMYTVKNADTRDDPSGGCARFLDTVQLYFILSKS